MISKVTAGALFATFLVCAPASLNATTKTSILASREDVEGLLTCLNKDRSVDEWNTCISDFSTACLNKTDRSTVEEAKCLSKTNDALEKIEIEKIDEVKAANIKNLDFLEKIDLLDFEHAGEFCKWPFKLLPSTASGAAAIAEHCFIRYNGEYIFELQDMISYTKSK